MSEELNFDDLTPQEIPVTYQGRSYLLREGSEGDVAAWKNAGTRYAVRNDKGEYMGASGGAELNAVLVAACLRERDTGKSVPVETVRGWPARVVQRLFDRAAVMSGLIAEQETPERLQEQFTALVKKLAGQAKDPAERRQWGDWMAGEVRDRAGLAEMNGSHEEREKNSPAESTAPTSPSA